MPLEQNFMDMDVGIIEKGDILSNCNLTDSMEKVGRKKVDLMREMVSKFAQIYYTGKAPSKKQFVKIFEEADQKNRLEFDSYMEQLENSNELVKLVKKKKGKDGKLILEFEPISKDDRIKLIKRIAKKLVAKLETKQFQKMIEVGLSNNARVDHLEDIDKELNKKKPIIKDYKGCFKLEINGKEIMILN